MGIQYATGIDKTLLDCFIHVVFTQTSLWNSGFGMENVMGGGLHTSQGRKSVELLRFMAP
ncbi:hypothetical protein PHMEG_00012145 [Phytophthora megakarya]|uniref:Uncharacterized protein n=1 Tax=Phytophthora megakarya TaxID=4795 RepID=A0A225W9X0_9STRA|nr:hypothetical protein PHMEG_00012145 [Phytophthora megakarya]